jgi:hypothetical protein
MAQTEMASNLELFDWKLANNAKNLQKLYALHKRRPDSICLAMRLQSHGRLICLCRDGKSYMLNRETGIFELDLREREEDLREFESFMLSERNRDSEGFLHLNEKKYVGFSNYDSIAVDVVGTAQATRNVNPLTKEDSITFVETAPGLRKVLSTLLESFDVPAKGWKTILKKFNAIVNDASRQCDFAWHCDVEDFATNRFPADVLTVVVQCSQALTAMRVLGHDPFFYSYRGATAIFPGLVTHQSIPRCGLRMPTVVKAVFFLAPPSSILGIPPDLSASIEYHYLVLSGPRLTNVSNNLSYRDRPDAPRLGAEALLGECATFILELRLFEFLDAGVDIPAAAFEQNVSTKTITCMERSALSSLWQVLQQRTAFGNYGPPSLFVQHDGKRVTGIVWFEFVKRPSRTVSASLLCIAALKGLGTTLHDAFIQHLKVSDVQHAFAPMAICRIKRGEWLRRLGWRGGSTIMDGDVLTMNVREFMAEPMTAGADRPV